MLKYRSNLKQPARTLRSHMTDAEQLLWSRLRRKQLLGVQFYQQKPIGPYVVDFYAPEARLVIEADGSQHLEEESTRRDRERDAYLGALGLRVLRFDDLQVLRETEAVLDAIYEAVVEARATKNPPYPPFSKGGAEDGALASTREDEDVPPFDKGGPPSSPALLPRLNRRGRRERSLPSPASLAGEGMGVRRGISPDAKRGRR
jgi:very-short-patch-repair endonuclease